MKNKNRFDQNSAHILHIRGLCRNSVSSPRQLTGFGEGFDSEQRDETAATVPASSWLDLINDKEPELRKDKIRKKSVFSIPVWLNENKRIVVCSELEKTKGYIFTGKATKCTPGRWTRQLQPWPSHKPAPLVARPPEHLLSPAEKSVRRGLGHWNGRKLWERSRRIRLFLNVCKNCIPLHSLVSRERGFKIYSSIWLSDKFEVWLGKKKKDKKGWFLSRN